MTDVGMSNVAAAPVVPAAPASIPIEQMTVDQAREAIRAKIHDKDFGGKLLKGDAAARQEWEGLHKRGFPAPQQITSTEDVMNQAAARNAEGWSQYVSWMRQQWAITPEQEAEIRGGVIKQEFHDWAREKKDRLVRDKNFYRRLMDGDSAAREEWARVTAMLALRPVKAA